MVFGFESLSYVRNQIHQMVTGGNQVTSKKSEVLTLQCWLILMFDGRMFGPFGWGWGSLSEFIFSRRRLWIVALGMRRRAGKRHFCAGDCDVKDDCLSWSHCIR